MATAICVFSSDPACPAAGCAHIEDFEPDPSVDFDEAVGVIGVDADTEPHATDEEVGAVTGIADGNGLSQPGASRDGEGFVAERKILGVACSDEDMSESVMANNG